MTLKKVLWKGLGQYVSNLIFSTNWKDLDQTFANMLTKVMVTNVDMFGARPELWKSRKFQCTRVVLKNLAVDVRFGADNLEMSLPHFLYQGHDRNDVT